MFQETAKHLDPTQRTSQKLLESKQLFETVYPVEGTTEWKLTKVLAKLGNESPNHTFETG